LPQEEEEEEEEEEKEEEKRCGWVRAACGGRRDRRKGKLEGARFALQQKFAHINFEGL